MFISLFSYFDGSGIQSVIQSLQHLCICFDDFRKMLYDVSYVLPHNDACDNREYHDQQPDDKTDDLQNGLVHRRLLRDRQTGIIGHPVRLPVPNKSAVCNIISFDTKSMTLGLDNRSVTH